VAVHRTLMARDSANVAAIRAITEVLMERRQEIPESMTEVRLLLVQMRRPEIRVGLEPTVHPGAISFYDKPSLLLAHADYVGLILTLGLMAGSWIRELKRWLQSSKWVSFCLITVQQAFRRFPLDGGAKLPTQVHGVA
jgi:hypothetical protein